MAEIVEPSATARPGIRRYIMIGDPVTSVRTPPLLEAQLRASGFEAEVVVRQVISDELERFMARCTSDHTIDGLMVTMPHKKSIMRFLASLSETAVRVGSVNVVKRLPSGELVGAQFDGIALVRALLAKNIDIASSRILLAGVGGAGMAIAHAFADHGCSKLVIAETDTKRRDAALANLSVRCNFPVAASLCEDDLRDKAVVMRGDYDLLVNATPLGMREGDPSPFGTDLIARAKCVADIVADPNVTRLSKLTRDVGAIFVTGREMVDAQVTPIAEWLIDP